MDIGPTYSRSVLPGRSIPRGSFFMALLLLVLLSMVVASPRARADAGTCSTFGNFFDGYYQDPSAQDKFRGVQALVSVVSPNLCVTVQGRNNFSTAWTMIADHYGAGWAQSGYFRYYGASQLFHWSEFSLNGSSWQDTFLPGPAYVNESYWYLQNWAPSCDGNAGFPCIQMKVGGTIISETPFDPYGNWTEPFSPEWFGETSYRESDVPGVPAARVSFSQMLVEDWNGAYLTSLPPLLARRDYNYASGQNAYCMDPWLDPSRVQATRAFEIWTADPGRTC